LALKCIYLRDDYNTPRCSSSYSGKGKGKTNSVQVWIGLQGSRRLRLPDINTVYTWGW